MRVLVHPSPAVCYRPLERFQNRITPEAANFRQHSDCHEYESGESCLCQLHFVEQKVRDEFVEAFHGHYPPWATPGKLDHFAVGSVVWSSPRQGLPFQSYLTADIPTFGREDADNGAIVAKLEVRTGGNCFLHDIHWAGHGGMRDIHIWCDEPQPGLLDMVADTVRELIS